jgi:transposase
MLKERSRLRVIKRNPSASNRALARLCNCSPTTIGKCRNRIAILDLTIEQLDEMTDTQVLTWLHGASARSAEKLEPDWDWVLLHLQKGRSRLHIYHKFSESVEAAAVIGYRTFCYRVGPLLDRKNPTMRIIHRAGEKLEMDFAGYKPRGILASEPSQFALFVAISPCSGMGFLCVVRDQSVPNWLLAVEMAFRYFGCVPSFLVSDNLKSAVISRPRNRPPVLNATFERFLDHHDTALRPARVLKPKDKPSVERLVRDGQQLLDIALEDRPLMTLDEMNAALLDISDKINARPERSGLGESRREFFDRVERPETKPANPHDFEFFEERSFKKVSRDYYLPFDRAFYMVPWELIGKPATLRAKRDTVEIIADGKVVFIHPRTWAAGERVFSKDLMPPNHRAELARRNADLSLWAEYLPEVVQELVAIEDQRGFTGVMRRDQYDLLTSLGRPSQREAFVAACNRAREAGTLTLSHVHNLLECNLQTVSRPAVAPQSAANDADANIRGPKYYSGSR